MIILTAYQLGPWDRIFLVCFVAFNLAVSGFRKVGWSTEEGGVRRWVSGCRMGSVSWHVGERQGSVEVFVVILVRGSVDCSYYSCIVIHKVGSFQLKYKEVNEVFGLRWPKVVDIISIVISFMIMARLVGEKDNYNLEFVKSILECFLLSILMLIDFNDVAPIKIILILIC